MAESLSSDRDEEAIQSIRGTQGDKKFRLGLVALVVVLAAVAILVLGLSITTGAAERGCNAAEGMFANGAVATTNYMATEVGKKILEEGGNVADAAIAIQLALGVVQPQSTGLGGGCFILLYNATTGDTIAIDAREEAPSLYHSKIFCASKSCFNATHPETANTCSCDSILTFQEGRRGGLSVGVPGVPAAMQKLWEEHASLPLEVLAAPAIKLAEGGFPMYQHLFNKITAHLGALNISDASAKLYLNRQRDGPICDVGETFYNVDLANTMREVVARGFKWFYDGSMVDEIVDAARDAVNPVTGRFGLLRKLDFNGYRAVRRSLVRQQLNNDLEYVGMSLPSSGGLSLSMMLGLWDDFTLSGDDLLPVVHEQTKNNMSLREVRRLVDVQNAVWADRQKYMGDADFVDVPSVGLHSAGYLRQRREEYVTCPGRSCSPRLDRHAQTPVSFGVPPGVVNVSAFAEPPREIISTTHFSAVDSKRNVIAVTTTIEENMGCGIVVPVTTGRGFLLNNELTDFAFRPFPKGRGEADLYPNAPSGERKPRRTALGVDAHSLGGKRPLSSMSPSLVMSGGVPILSIGAPGGTRIIGAVLNVLVQYISRGLSLEDAVKASRLVSKNEQVFFESEEQLNDMSHLEEFGFQTEQLPSSRPMPFIQAVIQRDQGKCVGAVADTTRFAPARGTGF